MAFEHNRLPVGYYLFNEDKLINFQLNRLFSTGFVDKDILFETGKQITDFNSLEIIMSKYAQKGIEEEDYYKASAFFRICEFFCKDKSKKIFYFQKCINCYKKAFSNLEYNEYWIPYKNFALYAVKFTTKCKKGIILMHGGYDSFIEEFFIAIQLFINSGYEVILFEGPGQGKVLYKYNIPLESTWEMPVRTILDYFNLSKIILIGISLGGYLATRASAYDKRISNLIMYDLIYDFFEAQMIAKSKRDKIILNFLINTKQKCIINQMEKKTRKDSFFGDWILTQGFNVFGVTNLYDYLLEIKKYSTRNISDRISQDVLILAGEEDVYTNFIIQQKKLLINANSISCRVFRKDENSSHHCQVGNIKLAFSEMIMWLNRFY